jgi:2-iminoacetate synthase ThiH
MTSTDLIQLINTEGYIAVERDTFYNEINNKGVTI